MLAYTCIAARDPTRRLTSGFAVGILALCCKARENVSTYQNLERWKLNFGGFVSVCCFQQVQRYYLDL